MRIQLDTTVTLTDPEYSDASYATDHVRIEGTAKGLAALKEAVSKRLQTEQYEHVIYSFRYGLRTKDLLGADRAYVQAELRRRTEETLLSDDRITGVGNYSFSFAGDRCSCEFDVESRFGGFRYGLEAVI